MLSRGIIRFAMSQRTSNPFEDTANPAQKNCRLAVAELKNQEVIARFYKWVEVTHEQHRCELLYLKAERRRLKYSVLSHAQLEEHEPWREVCHAIAWTEENFLLLDDYIDEITSNETGVFNASHPSGLVLWLHYRDLILAAARTQSASLGSSVSESVTPP